MTVEPYDNLIKVVRSLEPKDQEELVRRVKEMVGSSTIEALTAFIATQVNREVFVHLIREFTKEKGG